MCMCIQFNRVLVVGTPAINAIKICMLILLIDYFGLFPIKQQMI